MSRLLRDAMGSNRFAIMDTTGTSRNPKDQELFVRMKATSAKIMAIRNRNVLTHMPLRACSISTFIRSFCLFDPSIVKASFQRHIRSCTFRGYLLKSSGFGGMPEYDSLTPIYISVAITCAVSSGFVISGWTRFSIKDADGRIISWQARYQSPVNPKQRIYRRFGAEFRAEAFRWLDEEYAIVVEHRKGICQWVHPSKRTAREHPLFGAYAGAYVSNLRKKDGTELSGRTKRCQKAALDKLLPWFGDVRMDDITEEFVNEWYGKAREDVRPSALEHAASPLKRIMKSAPSAIGTTVRASPTARTAAPCRDFAYSSLCAFTARHRSQRS